MAFVDLNADILSRIVTDHLPFPVFARLLETNKTIRAKLKPEFDAKSDTALLTIAHVANTVGAALFHLRPFQEHTMEWSFGGHVGSKTVSVIVPMLRPVIIVHTRQLGSSQPRKFKFIMDSDTAGTFIDNRGSRGEFTDGVLGVLRAWDAVSPRDVFDEIR